MRDFKNIVAVTVFTAFLMWIYNREGDLPNAFYYVTFIFVPVAFTYRLFFSRKVRFKNLILTKFNLLWARKKTEIILGIDAETVYDLLLEFKNDLDSLNLVDADKNQKCLLYRSKSNWLTWGSNVYFTLEEITSNETKIKIDVVAFQVYNWGESEKIIEQIRSSINNNLVV